MHNHKTVLVSGIIFLLAVSLILVSGCVYDQPEKNNTQNLHSTPDSTTGTLATVTLPPALNNRSSGPGKYPVAGSPEKIQITVNSATLYRTLPGWDIKAGNGIAVINVSIKNNLAVEHWISREYLFIRSESDTALDHGGERLSSEMASKYLRFPIKLAPGETKTGSLVYIVHYGTRVNNLILSDTDVLREPNISVLAKIDLNKIYTYS